MTEHDVNWRQLREFADVDLATSFVLSWKYETGTLFIDVDVVLLPDHAFYEKPRPREKVCIRPAIIEFPACAAVLADDETPGGDITVDNLGHGVIDDLRLVSDGCYEISGAFGNVTIEAERPLLRLKTP